ncbi:MAG: hypothetical protein M3261_02510, partial [Thermoproteota archaeon]|nr:hypothetical protein [Thermoproteota archaeon]
SQASIIVIYTLKVRGVTSVTPFVTHLESYNKSFSLCYESLFYVDAAVSFFDASAYCENEHQLNCHKRYLQIAMSIKHLVVKVQKVRVAVIKHASMLPKFKCGCGTMRVREVGERMCAILMSRQTISICF